MEAPNRPAVGSRGEELDCDRLAELQVVRPVDLPHSAAAEQGDDAESTAEDGPWGELKCPRLRLCGENLGQI
jgi:hypothetical protein